MCVCMCISVYTQYIYPHTYAHKNIMCVIYYIDVYTHARTYMYMSTYNIYTYFKKKKRSYLSWAD